jgi:hypothetical protein
MLRIIFILAFLAIPFAAEASSQNSIAVPAGQGQQGFRAPSPYPAYPVPQQQPGQPNRVACTMEAKMCPDGSYVSRTGPNCEFTPCPGGTGGAMPTPAPQPQEPQGVPDLPVVGIPSSAVSVEYLTEHRSALAGKILTVKGYVTDYCGANDECGEPRIILADEPDGSGYTMSIYQSASDPTTYTVGQQVEVYGEASSEGDTAALRKE